MEPAALSLRAPAKVNLVLQVLGRRPDGYHDLRMLNVPVSLFDEVRLERLPAPGVDVVCAGEGGAPAGDENLCAVAARFFFGCTGAPGGVRVRLRKGIPAGAGLGGGSSDAAATLMGLERLTGRSLSDADRADAAFRVGADVPFFFARSAAWVEGIGERVLPLPRLPALWLVLVHPGVFLSTGRVFSGITRGLTTPDPLHTITQFNFPGLVGGLRNDLQATAVALEPVVAEALDLLVSAGAPASLMSGSGSAVFGLFPDESSAREASASAGAEPRARGWRIQVVRTLPPRGFPFPDP